jgi:hypothetical protein
MKTIENQVTLSTIHLFNPHPQTAGSTVVPATAPLRPSSCAYFHYLLKWELVTRVLVGASLASNDHLDASCIYQAHYEWYLRRTRVTSGEGDTTSLRAGKNTPQGKHLQKPFVARCWCSSVCKHARAYFFAVFISIRAVASAGGRAPPISTHATHTFHLRGRTPHGIQALPLGSEPFGAP